MPLITIDGASGIGKSLIAAQLSAISRWPVILEGEQGVLPDWILKSFADPQQAIPRTEWFTERCRLAGHRARDIAFGHRHCFVDVGPLTQRSYTQITADQFFFDVGPSERRLEKFQPDLSVLFIADAAFIRQNIGRRGRETELNEAFIKRILEVQDRCLSLAQEYNVLIIKRDDRDYLRSADINELWQQISAMVTPVNGVYLETLFPPEE